MDTMPTWDSHIPTFHSTTMDELSRLFIHHVEYRIIVCTACQFAVVPCQVLQHLKKHHNRLTLQQRRTVAEKVCSLPQLALVETDVIYPRPDQLLINTLPIVFDRLKCIGKYEDSNTYRYICCIITNMQKYCIDEYGYVNT